jgi:hypothetical protein
MSLVAAAALVLGTPLLLPTPAHAAGACPRGWIQRAVWNEGSFTVYVMSTADRVRVIGKIINNGAEGVDVQADHGSALLGPVITTVPHGQAWCSNSAPQPITVWASPHSDPSWGPAHTYPAGAPDSGPVQS